MSQKNNQVRTLRNSNYFIRIINYMPEVYEGKFLYLHQEKGIFEFKAGKRGATMFDTKRAMVMIKDLMKNGYEKYKVEPVDCYED